MSQADANAKHRYALKCMMESPIGSEARKTWKKICREYEAIKNALTVYETVEGRA